MPYFKDCLGALDGTHIAAHVPATECIPFRNRKGFLSQNVLAVCTFLMLFSYVLPGWEGSAHDSRVLSDAIHHKGFNPPQGKYYLADAGYSNTDYLLTPYRSTRYHLKEQRQANQKPQNARELFNLRHSSLRNVIERIFGVLKRRFAILNTPMKYSFATQVKIIYALTALHNFIIEHSTEEEIEIGLDIDIGQAAAEANDIEAPKTKSSSKKMDKLRDDMADAMWKDYQSRISRDYV